MKITKTIAFGTLVLSVFLSGFYFQSQIGNKKDVDYFFTGLNVKAKEIIEINYPQDLVISVKKGQIFLNQKLPYCLLLDNKLNAGIVFDGSESLNIKAFSEKPKNFPCKPYLIVGQNFIGGMKDDGEIKAWQVPSEVDVEIDQQMLLTNKDKFLPIVEKQGRRLYSLLPLIIFIVVLPFIMLANFWYSLVVNLLAKLFKTSTNPEIKNRYWIALFFGSVLGIINSIFVYFGYPFISFPFSGSILIGAASIIYLKYFSNQITEIEDVKPKPKKVVKKKK